MDMSYLTGPLIGAVIGYFTNYLAVKMLFHPRKAIKSVNLRCRLHQVQFQKGKTDWQQQLVMQLEIPF